MGSGQLACHQPTIKSCETQVVLGLYVFIIIRLLLLSVVFVCLFAWLVGFEDRVFLCSPGYPGTYDVD